ncbi:group 1 truncated hemoglobin [Spongiibacter taiwanensis]|uniref:group I truncated hemoglobin n=1 Tax=Spongiibacter taiwanensis TaxID=1748242 RepID=UPI0020363F71|nr:group 1 truncated hemoglobin [Spongiibacter taiwanensis]USA44393.1 group 1 truncated hemoglobin [Spongiibacter taiwanensis]
MKTFAKYLMFISLMFACAMPLQAQTGKTKTLPPLDDDALEQWGGKEGIRNWVESLFYYIMLDNRINHIFREFGNVERQIFLNTQLEQLVLGGDVQYQGASMAAAHADLGITVTQFNAVVEAAYKACERVEVTYEACNQLIAALAPYERVIVTR